MKMLKAVILGIILSTGTIVGCASVTPIQVEYTATLENELMKLLYDANAVVNTANELVESGIIVPGSTVYNKLDRIFKHMGSVADELLTAIQLEDAVRGLVAKNDMVEVLLLARKAIKEAEGA